MIFFLVKNRSCTVVPQWSIEGRNKSRIQTLMCRLQDTNDDRAKNNRLGPFPLVDGNELLGDNSWGWKIRV